MLFQSVSFSSFFLNGFFSGNYSFRSLGNDSLETKTIDSLGYHKTFRDFNSLKREIDTIKTRLQHIGFIETQITSTQKINDSTYQSEFHLKERFYTIYIYYNKNEVSKALLSNFIDNVTDDHFVVPISKVEDVLNYINSKIAEEGQPFVTLRLVDLKKKDDKHLSASLKIFTDKKRSVNNIIIKGYEKFPKSFIKHFLKIKSGNDFNLNDIKEKAEAINVLNFARQTKPPEVLFTKDATDIYFYIEKSKSNSFDGFLGFGTNEATNKLEFDGYLNLNLINNLNYGEVFRLSYKSR